MSREIRCPNCGGEHQLANPGITMLVCSFCKTVVYWDETAVLQTGAQSVLPESDARLFLHATGKLDGRGFQVVGHVRYDHGRGAWDEWYLQLDDGGVAWLSEDERELTHEQAAQLQAAPAREQLRVGLGVQADGALFSVREVGQATCVGGEGQLPFAIMPGASHAYADIATPDGTRFGTLEYDAPGRPSCYLGRPLTHEQLALDDEPPPSTAGAKHGSHIKCTSCAGPLEVPGGREVQTLVCEYCGAQLDLTAAQAQVLGVNPQGLAERFVFAIGDAATFHGKRYEVCGRMLYQDPEGYLTLEYLLHNADSGYLWLAEESGHYVLNRPTQQAPSLNPFGLPTKAGVTVGGTTFRMYESGSVRLQYVDGALPWVARSGDTFNYADLVAPPQIYSAESDGREVEYFHGRYLPVAEVWAAFGRSDRWLSPSGVHAAQPFQRGPVAKLLMLLGGLFALVNLGLLRWSLTKPGDVIYSETFAASEYLNECFSKPFAVGTQGKIVTLDVRAPLRNSWLYVQIGLVNAQDQVVCEAESEISYYQGVEGGESWSEGSHDSSTLFTAPPAGTYRLVLKGQGGSGELQGPPGSEPLSITLRQGGVLSRYFLALLIFAALFPLFEIMRQALFEGRRWGPVTEDDDDDDD